MSDREISAIHVDGGLYGLKDAVARAQQTTFKIFDAEPFKADLSVVKLSAEDYEQLVSGGNAVSNVLYIVEGEDEDMYGQRVKNVGWPTDLSDAATKLYVDSAVSAARVDHIEDSVNSISANLSYSASFPVSAAFEFTNGDGQTFVLTSDDGVDFLYEEAGVKKIDLGYYADCWNYSEYYWDNDND